MLYTHKTVFAAILAQVVRVQNVAQKSEAFRYLRFMRERPHMGRTLCADVPSMGLLRGDRLHPNDDLVDIHMFEQTQVPFTALFFRCNAEDRLIYVTPLCRVPGISVETYCVDLLHAWHLGGLNYYVAYALTVILKTKVFAPGIAGLPLQDCYRLALVHIKTKLWSYYRDLYRQDPRWRKAGSEVQHSETHKHENSNCNINNTSNNTIILIILRNIICYYNTHHNSDNGCHRLRMLGVEHHAENAEKRIRPSRRVRPCWRQRQQRQKACLRLWF